MAEPGIRVWLRTIWEKSLGGSNPLSPTKDFVANKVKLWYNIFMSREKRKKYIRRKKKGEFQFVLKPETRRTVLAVFLFALAIIGYLSLLQTAGLAGRYIAYILNIFFGWGAWFFLLILVVIGYFLVSGDRYKLTGFSLLGLGLFALSYLGLLHLTVPQNLAEFAVSYGQGGGWLGFLVSQMLRHVLGLAGSLVVFVALLVIGLVVAIETSLKPLAEDKQTGRKYWSLGLIKKLWQRMKALTQKRGGIPAIAEKEVGFKEEEVGLETDRLPLASRRAKPLSGGKSFGKIELPLDLLEKNSTRPVMAGDIKANKLIIQKTLEGFGIPVAMGEVKIGPTVTQYTLKPADGIKLAQITALHNDLALSLASHPIRIEAPIPGKSLVGLEVPNKQVAVVRLREVLGSQTFKNSRSGLTFALGKDVAGNCWVADLGRMPHLLIAGATGSGKTVMLNAIIVSLLYRNSPSNLKFILVDPKRVELVSYNDIPYLLTPVVTDVKKTINAFRWAISEMDRRFDLFSQFHRRDIHDFNADKDKETLLPHIVIIVDELADLMVAAPREIEACIIRLAQMARATGIHLVMATQRPSVDVLTGLIKANVTSRIAFAVASAIDSRTILDFSGAEKLLGRGDMLFVTPALSYPKRIQGAYVSDGEIKAIAEYLKKEGQPDYLDIPEGFDKGGEDFGILESDELLSEARQVVIRAKRASASLLQRRLRVGYARAARLLDLMEEEGTIGPSRGAKPRKVLIGGEETEQIEETET